MRTIFKFLNKFDDSEVELCWSDDNAPPYIVTVKFNDPAISNKEETHEFQGFTNALSKFNHLVQAELQAVAGELLGF